MAVEIRLLSVFAVVILVAGEIRGIDPDLKELDDKASGGNEGTVLDEKDIITELNPEWTEDGQELLEGDIILTPDQEEELEERKGTLNVLSLWLGGRIPYNFHSSINNKTKILIREAMDHWEEKTCLKFVERSLDLSYLRFRGDKNGCYSFIGRVTTPLLGQDVSIGKGCEHLNIVVHEIGHAIGFFHEQSRQDRDKFINIIWKNIKTRSRSQFEKGLESPRGVDYDYTSVMQYGPMAFSSKMFEKNTIVAKNPHYQRLIGASRGLSFRDAKTANILYMCNTDCPNIGEEPECQKDGYFSPYRGDSKPCHCVCPPDTEGEHCENVVGDYYESSPCGGNVTTEGEISTPGYPERIETEDDCSWWIQAPDKQRVRVEFEDFSFYPRYEGSATEYKGKCVFERVEIRAASRDDGDMYCGEDIAPGTILISKSKDFVIIISSHPKSHRGRGLKARVSFVEQ